MVAFAYTTWLERKLLGRMQLRYGPNRAGPFGLLQPIADLIKLVRKEAFAPQSAVDTLYIAAPALALFALGVVLMGQSLNLTEIVGKQEATIWFFIPQFVGLVVFLIGGIAETSRPPFDLPEADTELVAGYATEYSGMRWGLFQNAEYVNMITLSALAVTLFFDGWHFPWVDQLDALGPLWFMLKLGVLVSAFIWLRASLPRLRYDQLMRFGWKVLLPVATVNALVTAFFVVLI